MLPRPRAFLGSNSNMIITMGEEISIFLIDFLLGQYHHSMHMQGIERWITNLASRMHVPASWDDNVSSFKNIHSLAYSEHQLKKITNGGIKKEDASCVIFDSSCIIQHQDDQKV